MCLYIRRPFKNLKGFIHVYKVGLIFDNKFLSPYQRAIIPFNTLWNDPMFHKSYNRRIVTMQGDFEYVQEGFVHCYDNYESAKYFADCYEFDVFDAIIPSNSIGYWGFCNEICTNKIIILNPKQSFSYSEICKEYNLSII